MVWDLVDLIVTMGFSTLLVRTVFWVLPDRRPVGQAGPARVEHSELPPASEAAKEELEEAATERPRAPP